MERTKAGLEKALSSSSIPFRSRHSRRPCCFWRHLSLPLPACCLPACVIDAWLYGHKTRQCPGPVSQSRRRREGSSSILNLVVECRHFCSETPISSLILPHRPDLPGVMNEDWRIGLWWAHKPHQCLTESFTPAEFISLRR